MASRDWKPFVAPPKTPERVLLSPEDPQPAAPLGAIYQDPVDKVNYRVVDHLDLGEGWCTELQLTRHYHVDREVLLDWARRGLVDPVIERGSPTRRYRVRDHDKLYDLAQEAKRSKRRRS